MTIKATCQGLNAPALFWLTDEATLAMMTGGCGPGKTGDYLVPDTVYGLSVKAACIIHDYEYAVGITMEDKRQADLNFLENLVKIVNRDSKSRLLRWARRYRIMSYYSAVADGGGSSFEKAALN